MHQYTGTVIEAQPDWLTVSAHGERRAKALLDLAVGLAKEEESHGAKPRKWRSMGYEGIHAGRVEYGQRDARATELRLSGDAARMFLDPALALADRVTRLDLAVTWRSDEPAPDLGRESYESAVAWHSIKPRSALPWTVNDAAGGFTCYIGQRESEYFFRLYNKESQERRQMGKSYDGRYDRCWRYELETKASVPDLILKKLDRAPDQARWIQDYIHTYATAHGLQPPFDSAGGLALISGFRRHSDADSKLNHIAKNVRPTVEWLIKAGRGDDLRKALGFGPDNPFLS